MTTKHPHLKPRLSRWYFRFPGHFYAWGPTTGRYATEREARASIRRAGNLARLPRGFEIWRAD